MHIGEQYVGNVVPRERIGFFNLQSILLRSEYHPLDRYYPREQAQDKEKDEDRNLAFIGRV